MHNIKDHNTDPHQHGVQHAKVHLVRDEVPVPPLCQLDASVDIPYHDEQSTGRPDQQREPEAGFGVEIVSLVRARDDEEPQDDKDTHGCELDGDTREHDVRAVGGLAWRVAARGDPTAGSLDGDADEIEDDEDEEVEAWG